MRVRLSVLWRDPREEDGPKDMARERRPIGSILCIGDSLFENRSIGAWRIFELLQWLEDAIGGLAALGGDDAEDLLLRARLLERAVMPPVVHGVCSACRDELSRECSLVGADEVDD